MDMDPVTRYWLVTKQLLLGWKTICWRQGFKSKPHAGKDG